MVLDEVQYLDGALFASGSDFDRFKVFGKPVAFRLQLGERCGSGGANALNLARQDCSLQQFTDVNRRYGENSAGPVMQPVYKEDSSICCCRCQGMIEPIVP